MKSLRSTRSAASERGGGHSTFKADLFPDTKPNILRAYVKLGRVTARGLLGSILRRCPEIAPDLPCSRQEPGVRRPSLGWDVHPKVVWCADRSSTDSPDPWDAALLGHARLFQGAFLCRVMEEGKIRDWVTV